MKDDVDADAFYRVRCYVACAGELPRPTQDRNL